MSLQRTLRDFLDYSPCRIAIILAILTLSIVSPSLGQGVMRRFRTSGGPVDIEAKEVWYYQKQNLYRARGNVKITKAETTLKADEVEYHTDTQIAEAAGHVELTDGHDVLQCEKMRINMETQQGVIEEARLKTRENFYVTGKRIEKLGPQTYRIYDGTFTTCSTKSPAWIFTAKRVDLTVEGLAYARQATFEVKGVPVMYLPFGEYPLKTKRQTGFLLPNFGYSSKYGPEVGVPFFWAIDQDKDATFYLDYHGDAGLKEGGEFRYAPSRETHGQVNFNFINDQTVKEDRWSFLAYHDERQLPLGFYARGNVNLVSDSNYPSDYPEDFPSRSLMDVTSGRYLRSTLFSGRPWPQYNLIGDLDYFRNLTVENNAATLQKLPEITFSAFDQPLWQTPLYAGGDFSYTNFWRKEGVKGSRLDAFPEISLPFRPLEWLQFLPKAGVEETLYWPEDNPSGANQFSTRTLPTFDALLSAKVSRFFEPAPLMYDKIKHTIQPEIEYTYIPPVNQRNLPSFDAKDQIPYTNQITYGLTNFFDGKTPRGGPWPDIHRIIQLELFQSYSLGDPFFPDEHSWKRQFSNIMGRLWFYPTPHLYLRTDAEYSLVQNGIALFNNLLTLSDARGDSISGSYQYTKDQIQTVNFSASVKVLEQATLFGTYVYDLLNGVAIETIGGITYRQQCWNVTFAVDDLTSSGQRQTRFTLTITLVGLGSMGKTF